MTFNLPAARISLLENNAIDNSYSSDNEASLIKIKSVGFIKTYSCPGESTILLTNVLELQLYVGRLLAGVKIYIAVDLKKGQQVALILYSCSSTSMQKVPAAHQLAYGAPVIMHRRRFPARFERAWWRFRPGGRSGIGIRQAARASI